MLKSWKSLVFILIIIFIGLVFVVNRPGLISKRKFFDDYNNIYNQIVRNQQSFSDFLFRSTPAGGGDLAIQEIEEFQKDLLFTKNEIQKMEAQLKKERQIKKYLLVSVEHLNKGTIYLNRYVQTKDEKIYLKAFMEEQKSSQSFSKSRELVFGRKI